MVMQTGDAMSNLTIRDLYVAELSDLFDAEQQTLRELPLLAAAATACELREAFDLHYRETQRHVQRLTALFRDLDEWPRGATCRPLRVLIEEARLRNAAVGRGAALDAALIATAQRIEHFEIAGYRCASAYAVSVANASGVEVLQETLEEEGGMDRRLMELAIAGGLASARLRPAADLSARPGSVAGRHISH
jgi:ferritin-like metal-binding protein YciE